MPTSPNDTAAATEQPPDSSLRRQQSLGGLAHRELNSPALQLIATVALLALPGWLFLGRYYLVDPDIWWHLRTAHWIVAHHGVPGADPFSAFGAGKPWIAYSWLWDLFVGLLDRWFGLAGMILYEVAARTALAAALFHLARGRTQNFWRAWFFAAALLYVMLQVVGPRPGMITILFCIVELDLLLAARSGDAWRLWLLPPLFAVWANCHIQFVYGLFMLGLLVAEPVLNAALRYRVEPLLPGAFAQRGLLFALCALATLVNPYGWRVYATVAEYMGQHKAFHYIEELRSMDFRHPQHYAALLLSLGAAFCLGWRRNLRPVWLVLLAVSAALSFRAVKDVWFVALISLCILAGVDFAQRRPEPLRVRLKTAAAAAILTLAVLAVGYRRYNVTNDFVEMSVAGKFPVGAARYVAQHRLPGPLYNDFNDGGYLIWALPDYKVAMDGRTNVHGDQRVEESSRVWRALPEWASDPDLKAARTIIALREAPLTSLLKTQPEYRIVYEDTQYLVFERR